MKWLSGLVVILALSAAYALVRSAPTPWRTVASYTTSLHGRDRDQRHNAVLCLGKLRGAVIEPGETFSFNQRVGSWSRDAGYRKAPVSYGGQLIPFWGGGVCQTSSTLYNAGLLAGMEVVERHRHHFAPSYVNPGLDAAVAYSNVDLKLRNPYEFALQIEGRVENGRLIVEILARRDLPVVPTVVQEFDAIHESSRLITGDGPVQRLRNPGKAGARVRTYRVWPDRTELLSHDSYPVMQRVIERSAGIP